MTYDLSKLSHLIQQASKQELLPRFANVKRNIKGDGSFVTEADLACQHAIQKQLEELYPEHVFLAEEMTEEEQADLINSEKPIWCLDPLDGTSNFAAGIPYFSVSLCLIHKGEVQLAIVYDPTRDECFSAQHGHGAFLNQQPLSMPVHSLPLKQCTALIDFKRLDCRLKTKLINNPPYASQRSFGSVALDWCWLAAGRVHVYLHGRSNIWDYAGGEFIFREAGGDSCSLDGNAVFVKASIARSSVGAVNKELFTEWCQFLEID